MTDRSAVAKKILLSIVVPCYNEALNIPLLLKRYAEVKEEFPFELILINNGSTDQSADVLSRELQNPAYPFVRVVAVPKNRGYGHGIMTGLREAAGDYLAFSHADMQCDANDVFLAYHELLKSKDPEKTVVKGQRVNRELGESLFTFGMSVIASVVLRKRLVDVNAQPKVFHRNLLRDLTNPPIGLEFDLYCLYLAKKHQMNVKTIPVHFGRRAHGHSKWAVNPMSKIKHSLSMVAYIFKLAGEKPQPISESPQS